MVIWRSPTQVSAGPCPERRRPNTALLGGRIYNATMRLPNSIDTRKFCAGKTAFAGRDWSYDFKQIPVALEEDVAKKKIEKLLSRYAKITKSWNDHDNSIWICRLYMATKLIMMATLQVNSLQFAGRVNLRVASPHLQYYSLLSLARAVCLTIPEIDWADGELLKMSHARAIKQTVDYLASFDRSLAQSVNDAIRSAKAQRELIDYRAPTSGDAKIGALQDLILKCRLLAEFAQLNSELLESSFEKHNSNSDFDVEDEEIMKILSVEIEGEVFLDDEDYYRVGYILRKHPRPASLQMLMTDGHVEDFFGAWCDKEDKEASFDPDSDLGVIFDI